MPRPCLCDHLPPAGQPYTADYCRLCWLYYFDWEYHARWSDPPPQRRTNSMRPSRTELHRLPGTTA
jgi:hypothetical protein